MNANHALRASTAVELRRSFDRSFAAAPNAAADTLEDLLAIGVAGDPYAVRLGEVAGIFADRQVMWLPGAVPELRGLIGVRGDVLPVYDLRCLLGYPKAEASRWFLIPADMRVALNFERFDGHLRVRREAIARDCSADPRQPHGQEVVRVDDVTRPIIHVPSVLDRIRTLVRQGATPKEY